MPTCPELLYHNAYLSRIATAMPTSVELLPPAAMPISPELLQQYPPPPHAWLINYENLYFLLNTISNTT